MQKCNPCRTPIDTEFKSGADCHEPNSPKYPNGKGVVRVTSRGLDMALHWSGVGAAPLMSPRQDETSEPLLYAGWMAGPYRCKDATQGQNDDPVTSGIRA
ncbi:hypothetical protein Tco_0525787 [Tanacetum coccineum]